MPLPTPAGFHGTYSPPPKSGMHDDDHFFLPSFLLHAQSSSMASSSSIDELSDEALHHILSFLPTTKLRAATSLVSRRWRHLWTDVPSFDFRLADFLEHSPWTYAHTVHECLRRFSRTLHRFSADLPFDHIEHRKAYRALDRWIRILSTTSLSELSLNGIHHYPCAQLPPSVLSLAPSLRVLRLYNCDLTGIDWAAAEIPHCRGFQRLDTLALDRVAIRDKQLHALLAACPLIENLTIDRMQVTLNLSSSVNPRLKKFEAKNTPASECVGKWKWFQATIDLAELETLELAGATMRDLRLIASPKLREVGLFPFTSYHAARQKMPQALSGVEILSANASFFNVEYKERQDFALANLKVLSGSKIPGYRNPKFASLIAFVSFLERCPSLDTLYVSLCCFNLFDLDDDVELEKFDAGSTSSCPVKKIVVRNVIGYRRDKALMKYFLGKMACLECLSIVFNERNRPGICEEQQLLEEVQMFARASPVANVIMQTRNTIPA